MKTLFIIIFAIISFYSVGQTKKYDFIEINYNEDGSILSKKSSHFDSVTMKIDIFFYNKNFSEPFHIPEKFVDKKYKKDSVILWNNIDDKISKSSKTFIYDSLSRIISYSYSGCMICSQFKYDYMVTYNNLNQPIRLYNNISKDEYEIKYNNEGDLIELNCYFFDKLIRKIKLK